MDSNPTLSPRLVHLFKKSRAERYGITNAYVYKIGNYIQALVPGFPAEKMGIQVDDIIFEVNGHDVMDLNVEGVAKLINKFPTRTSLLVLDPIAVDYYKINKIPINGQMEGIIESVDWPEWFKVAEKKVTVAETETETQQNVQEEPETGIIVTGNAFENVEEICVNDNEISTQNAPDTENARNQNEHFNEATASMSRMEKTLLGIQELLVEIRDKISASHEAPPTTCAENTVNTTEVKTKEAEAVLAPTPEADNQHAYEQALFKFLKDWVDITNQ